MCSKCYGVKAKKGMDGRRGPSWVVISLVWHCSARYTHKGFALSQYCAFSALWEGVWRYFEQTRRGQKLGDGGRWCRFNLLSPSLLLAICGGFDVRLTSLFDLTYSGRDWRRRGLNVTQKQMADWVSSRWRVETHVEQNNHEADGYQYLLGMVLGPRCSQTAHQPLCSRCTTGYC